jgi:hypothetical protein
MSRPHRVQFYVYNPGEEGAGIAPYSDDITLRAMSGDPGGDPGEFDEFVRDCLAQWFDGAKVTIVKEGEPT